MITLVVTGLGFGFGALRLRMEGSALFLWALCLGLLGLAWLLGRPLWNGRPALAVGAAGLGSY